MLRWRRSWCKEGRRMQSWHLDHLKQKRMARMAQLMAQLIQLGLIPRNPTWMRLRASRTELSRLSHDSWDITLFNRRKFKCELVRDEVVGWWCEVICWFFCMTMSDIFLDLIWFIWHNRDNYSPNKLHKSCCLPWVFRKEKAMKFDIYTPRIEICTPREATVRPTRRTRSCLKVLQKSGLSRSCKPGSFG